MLYKAARLAGFPAANGWPDELNTIALASLMAGEEWRSRNLADMWGTRLDDEADAGRLLVRSEPKDAPGEPIFIIGLDTDWHFVTRDAFAAWLRTVGENPSELARAWLGDTWQDDAKEAMKAAPAALSAPNETLSERRTAAIVKTAIRLEYEPLRIAWGGKVTIKLECLKDARLFTNSTFDKAWQAAVNAGKIKVENSESYAKR
jgi:chromosome segregation and condensation protein ScpB